MPTAAYCNACKVFVFVSEDGECSNGHPRPNLRDIYEAEINRRTGSPRPPRERVERRVPSMPTVSFAGFAQSVAAVAAPAGASSVREPVAPVPPVYCDVEGGPYGAPGPLDRLFGPPRGRHSRVAHAPALELGNVVAILALSIALVATAVLIGYVAGSGESIGANDLLALLAYGG